MAAFQSFKLESLIKRSSATGHTPGDGQVAQKARGSSWSSHLLCDHKVVAPIMPSWPVCSEAAEVG